jgi:hypothetical protein
MAAREAADVAPSQPTAIDVAETVTEDLVMEEGDTFHGQSSNMSAGVRPTKETAVDSHIAKIVVEWETKLISLVHQYNEAAGNGDTQALQKIEVEMMQARRHLTHFRSCMDNNGKESYAEKPRVNMGLTLTRKDLPKYQITTSMNKPFPKEDSYDSEEHFLRTFERIVYSAGLDIEYVWDRYLPLCIHYDHDMWIEADLKCCSSWSDARKCFTKKFETKHRARESTTLVFTMEMRGTESIPQYTARFIKAINDANLNVHDNMLAQRFLASLIKPVQMLAKIALHNRPDAELTIEEISKIAQEIFGDDCKSYTAEAMLMNAGIHLDSYQGKKRCLG